MVWQLLFDWWVFFLCQWLNDLCLFVSILSLCQNAFICYFIYLFFLCGCVQYLNPLNLLNWLLDFTEIIAEGIQNYYIFFFKNEYESTECKPLSLSQNNMILNEKLFTFL